MSVDSQTTVLSQVKSQDSSRDDVVESLSNRVAELTEAVRLQQELLELKNDSLRNASNSLRVSEKLNRELARLLVDAESKPKADLASARKKRRDAETRADTYKTRLMHMQVIVDKLMNSREKNIPKTTNTTTIHENEHEASQEVRQRQSSKKRKKLGGNGKESSPPPPQRDVDLPALPSKFEPVVRKKDERAGLKAYACADCRTFYEELDPKVYSQGTVERLINTVSRHRCQHAPPQATPEHYWSMISLDDDESQGASKAVD